MSNETRIGLFAVIVIAIFIWGYKFLKGQNVFTTSTELYVEYDQVNQLAQSAPVFINGFQVGVVTSIYLKPEDMQTIITVLSIDRGVNVPKDAVAEIISTGFIGGPAISLFFDKACMGANCAQSGDYIKGRVKGLLESMIAKDELDEYMGKISENVDVAVDNLNKKLADPDPNNLIGQTVQDLRATSANLKAATSRLNSLLGSRQISSILTNLNNITDSIEASGGSIKGMLDNTAAFTSQLKDIRLDSTMDNANAMLRQTQQTVAELETTLKTANLAVGELAALIAKVKNGEGTIGKLIADEGLYNKLLETTNQINGFIQDVEARPYRYIPLKSRKKVEKYDAKDAKQ